MVMLFNSFIFTLYKTSQGKYTIQTISYKKTRVFTLHIDLESLFFYFFYTDKFT